MASTRYETKILSPEQIYDNFDKSYVSFNAQLRNLDTNQVETHERHGID